MDDDKILINLDIGDKHYPLRVLLSEESIARKGAKQIRNKIIQYRQQYLSADVNTKDLVSMVAIQLSIENLRLEDKNDTDPFVDKIQQLTGEIELYLKEGK